MTAARFGRWMAILSAAVLVVAVLIGLGLAFAWQHLPNAHLTIDGESVSLPALQGWPAALALLLAAAAVLLAAVLVIGLFAISLLVTVLCVVLVVIAVALSLLLVFSPLLLVGWLLWRLSQASSPAPAGARIAP